MALISLKCPECGGEVQFEETLKQGFCVYCGTKIINEKAVPNTVILDHKDEIVGKLELAKVALTSKEYEKAVSLADDAIVLDPNCLDAWCLKVIASDPISRTSCLQKAQSKDLNQYGVIDPNLINNYHKVLFIPTGRDPSKYSVSMIVDGFNLGIIHIDTNIETILSSGNHKFHIEVTRVSNNKTVVLKPIPFTIESDVSIVIKDGLTNVRLVKK